MLGVLSEPIVYRALVEPPTPSDLLAGQAALLGEFVERGPEDLKVFREFTNPGSDLPMTVSIPGETILFAPEGVFTFLPDAHVLRQSWTLLKLARTTTTIFQ